MGKKDKDDKHKLSFQLKTAKGTKDWSGADVLLRDKIFQTISNVFRAHGAVALDTPVFELRDVLAGKYGEDSKLIYDLQDQGGELCSLRYDLTVPFARWLAMNPDVKSIKRYAIAKVYRRDQPAMSKGRMREFYQCDFDFAGAVGDVMVPDSEIIRIIVEVFEALGWQGKYTVKVNHRKVLDGVFEVCGVPAEKTRMISSAVDKLDKVSWTEARKEMVEEKGLDPEVADRIESYVTLKGGRDLLDQLQNDTALLKSESAKQGVEEMGLLLQYLEAFGVLDKISVDMSLARGLDYYTGVIYEVITEGSAPVTADGADTAEATTQVVQQKSKKKKPAAAATDDDDRSDDPNVGVGSVAAGGRYDHLVDRFLPGADMPCVGISFGVDRIFSITKARMEQEKKLGELRGSETDVYVMAIGGSGFDGMLPQRMAVCKLLWDAGVKAEFFYKKKSKFQQQFSAAEKIGCALAVQLGEDEQMNGQVRLKELGLPKDHPEKDGVLVKIDVLAQQVKKKLASMASTMAEVVEIVGGTAKMNVEDPDEKKGGSVATERPATLSKEHGG